MVVVSSVTCPICGSLCDDLQLTIKDNTVVKVKNACAIGETKFLNYNKGRPTSPLVRKDGKLVEASWNEAIRKSAEILSKASYPILYGWSSTSCEAIKQGLELAEEIGGVIDNTSTVCHGPSVLGIHDIGMSSCTLGQLRHRADLVVYWGSNPWGAHPRHTERYTMFTEGKFKASTWRRYATRTGVGQIGKRYQRVNEITKNYKTAKKQSVENNNPSTLLQKGRKMIVVDSRCTRSAEAADFFLQVKPNSDYEIIQALRMIVRDEELDLDEVAGVPVGLLENVADAMINCELGVLFFGVGLTMSLGKHRNIDAALSLVRDLNRRTKFLIMPMRGHFNVTGANVVSLWETGYPYAVDFSKSYPQYNPGETSVVDILSRGESDAGLVIASDPVSNFPKDAVQNLVKKPLIVIDPVDKKRNVAAAVSKDRLGELIMASRLFLNRPDIAFFLPEKTAPLPLKEVSVRIGERGSDLVFIAFQSSAMAADVLWGQLFKTAQAFKGLLAQNDFQVLRDAVWSGGAEANILVFGLEARTIPLTKRHLGPPVTSKEAISFVEKYEGNNVTAFGPWVEEGRWVVAAKRHYTDAATLLKDSLSECERTGVAAGLVHCVSEAKVYVNEKILDVYSSNRDFAEFLTEFLKGKPKWMD